MVNYLMSSISDTDNDSVNLRSLPCYNQINSTIRIILQLTIFPSILKVIIKIFNSVVNVDGLHVLSKILLFFGLNEHDLIFVSMI